MNATSKWAVGALAGLATAVMSFTIGIMSTPAIKITAWHHWGAYIGPAELVLSGARIFYDFPPNMALVQRC